MGESNFHQFIPRVFRDPKLNPGPAHQLLPTLKLSAILTTNYDKLIEQSFPAATRTYTQLDHPGLALTRRSSEFAIVKVHGDADRPESIVLGQGDYRQAMFANDPFRNFLTARAAGIQAYSRDEFISRLADFRPYPNKLVADYQSSEIEALFVPLTFRPEIAGEAQGDPMPLDDFIEAWLAAPERNHLSLLGDFGTGKTWFTRRLAAKLALKATGRTPSPSLCAITRAPTTLNKCLSR